MRQNRCACCNSTPAAVLFRPASQTARRWSGARRGQVNATACGAHGQGVDSGTPLQADGVHGEKRCWLGHRTSPHSSRTERCPRRAGPVARSGGTSPHSIRRRVAFPTLRPPRLRLFGGPVPWTKRGKRASRGALFEVGYADRGGNRRDRTSPHSSWVERCRGAEHRCRGPDGTSPHSNWAELRFLLFAHRAVGCFAPTTRP